MVSPLGKIFFVSALRGLVLKLIYNYGANPVVYLLACLLHDKPLCHQLFVP